MKKIKTDAFHDDNNNNTYLTDFLYYLTTYRRYKFKFITIINMIFGNITINYTLQKSTKL